MESMKTKIISRTPLKITIEEKKFLENTNINTKMNLNNVDIPDNEIINKILNGNQELYTILANRYHNMVKSSISKIITNTCDVDDLTNETLFKGFQQLDRYSDKFKFSTWICTIARNKGIDFYRKNKTKTIIYFEDIKSIYEEKTNENDKLRDDIDCALNKLDTKCAEMIKLHYYDGVPIREIGMKYNMSEYNVKINMFRSRNKLRNDQRLSLWIKKNDVLDI